MRNKYQIMVDQITKAKIVYIDVYKKIFTVLFGKGPFLMYVTKYLKKWGKVKKFKKGRLGIRDYYWYFRTYYSIYKKEENRMLLKLQK
jgi:hypothetical protein